MLYLDGAEHSGWRGLREAGESVTLNLVNLLRLSGAATPSGRVYILENEGVYCQLCDSAARFHSPLICTSGQPSAAAWRLLDLLAASGTRMFYAGDFDGNGLSIAGTMLERYGDLMSLWHMSEEDYLACLSDAILTEESRNRLRGEHASRVPVAEAVWQENRPGYQEGLLDRYLADLIGDPAVGG